LTPLPWPPWLLDYTRPNAARLHSPLCWVRPAQPSAKPLKFITQAMALQVGLMPEW